MTYKAVLGLDAAQAGAHFHLTDQTGQRLSHGDIPKTQTGWRQLCDTLDTFGVRPQECLIGIEATGVQHLPWCEALHQAAASPLVLNPLLAKRTTALGNAIRDHKSDPIDAEGLAETVRRDGDRLSRFAYRSEPAQVGLRKLQAVERVVRKSLTNILKHCGSLFDLVFPELDSLQLTRVQRRRLLQAAPTPARIAALPNAQLRRIVGEKAEAVRTCAQRSFAPAKLAEACVPAIEALLQSIAQLEDQLKQIERRIAECAPAAIPRQWLQLARSLPAFGEKTTPVVLAYLPAELIAREQSRKAKVARVQALFGIDPRVRTSGKWKGRIKLSKRGIRAARTALYQIALCSLVRDRDPESKAYYRYLRDEAKKPHKVAIFDLARKHLRRLVAVLDAGVPYSPSKSSISPCLQT